jgi:hypothetical protein
MIAGNHTAEADRHFETYQELWDWRRRIAELYAEIRAFDDPEFAWRLWRDTRDALFHAHPQSPLDKPAGVTSQASRCSSTTRRFAARSIWRPRRRSTGTPCPVAATATSS